MVGELKSPAQGFLQQTKSVNSGGENSVEISRKKWELF